MSLVYLPLLLFLAARIHVSMTTCQHVNLVIVSRITEYIFQSITTSCHSYSRALTAPRTMIGDTSKRELQSSIKYIILYEQIYI